MRTWHVHLCNARGHLTLLREELLGAITHAQKTCESVREPVALDLTVRATSWPMPDALEVSGSSYGPGRIDLAIDTSKDFAKGELRSSVLRTIFHEFHHVLRWDGPGFGQTLGEALVSEGLAQHFLHELMDCAPEPWEQAIDSSTLLKASQDAHQDFEKEAYDHAEWFFGSKQRPNWLGYSLGYDLVANFIAHTPGATALAHATTPANKFKRFLI